MNYLHEFFSNGINNNGWAILLKQAKTALHINLTYLKNLAKGARQVQNWNFSIVRSDLYSILWIHSMENKTKVWHEDEHKINDDDDGGDDNNDNDDGGDDDDNGNDTDDNDGNNDDAAATNR